MTEKLIFTAAEAGARMALVKMTPAEIDGELAKIHEERMRVNTRLVGYRKLIEETEDPTSRRGKRAHGVGGEMLPHEARFLAEVKESVKAGMEKLAELDAAAEPFKAEFTRRGGWRRYFLVVSSDGHIHRGMNCETCYPRTAYAWLPALSGCVEEEMVEKYGMKACTVCFPAAPTMPGWMKAEKEAAAEVEKKAGTHCAYKAPERGTVNYRLAHPRGTCPECGAKGVAVTRLGALRKHKRPTPKPA